MINTIKLYIKSSIYAATLLTCFSWLPAQATNNGNSKAPEQCQYFTETEYNNGYFVEDLKNLHGEDLVYPFLPSLDKSKNDLQISVNDVIEHSDQTETNNLKNNAELFKRRLTRLALINGVRAKSFYYRAFPFLKAQNQQQYDPYMGVLEKENVLNQCLTSKRHLKEVLLENQEFSQKIKPEALTQGGKERIEPFITDLVYAAIFSKALLARQDEINTRVENLQKELDQAKQLKSGTASWSLHIQQLLHKDSAEKRIENTTEKLGESQLHQSISLSMLSQMHQDYPILFEIKNQMNLSELDLVKMKYAESPALRLILRDLDSSTLGYMVKQLKVTDKKYDLSEVITPLVSHYKDYLNSYIQTFIDTPHKIDSLKRMVAKQINSLNDNLIGLCSNKNETLSMGQQEAHKLHLHPQLVSYAFKRRVYPVTAQKLRKQTNSLRQQNGVDIMFSADPDSKRKAKLALIQDMAGYCYLMKTEPPKDTSWWKPANILGLTFAILGLVLIPFGATMVTVTVLGSIGSAFFVYEFNKNSSYFGERLVETSVLASSALESSEAVLNLNEKLLDLKIDLTTEVFAVASAGIGTKAKMLSDVSKKTQNYSLELEEALYDYSLASKYKRYRTALNRGHLNKALLDQYDYKGYIRMMKERRQLFQQQAKDNSDVVSYFERKRDNWATFNSSGNQNVSNQLANDANKANIPTVNYAHYTVGAHSESKMASVAQVVEETSSENGVKALEVLNNVVQDVFTGFNKIDDLVKEGMVAGKQAEEMKAFLKGKTIMGRPNNAFHQAGAGKRVIKTQLSFLNKNGEWYKKTVSFTSAVEAINFSKAQAKVFKKTFAHTGMDELRHTSIIQDQWMRNAENYRTLEFLRDEFQRHIGALSKRDTKILAKYVHGTDTPNDHIIRIKEVLIKKGLNEDQVSLYMNMQRALNDPHFRPREDILIRLAYEEFKSEKAAFFTTSRAKEAILEKADVAMSAALRTNVTSAGKVSRFFSGTLEWLKTRKLWIAAGLTAGGSVSLGSFYNYYVRGTTIDAAIKEFNIHKRNTSRKFHNGYSGDERDCATTFDGAGRDFSFMLCYYKLIKTEIGVELSRTIDDENYDWRNDHNALRKINDYAYRMVKLRNRFHAANALKVAEDARQNAFLKVGFDKILNVIEIIEKHDPYVRHFARSVMTASSENSMKKALEVLKQEGYSEATQKLSYMAYKRKDDIVSHLKSYGKLPLDIKNLLSGHNAIEALVSAEDSVIDMSFTEIAAGVLIDIETKVGTIGIDLPLEKITEELKDEKPSDEPKPEGTNTEENENAAEEEDDSESGILNLIFGDS